MENLQQKICNVLTFLFLLGVIAGGVWSLWPEAEATPLTEPQPEEDTTELVPADTLEEVPMVEDVKEVKENRPDTLPADTIAAPVHPAQPADTARHAARPATPHTTPATPHTAPAAPAETKPATRQEADSTARA